MLKKRYSIKKNKLFSKNKSKKTVKTIKKKKRKKMNRTIQKGGTANTSKCIQLFLQTSIEHDDDGNTDDPDDFSTLVEKTYEIETQWSVQLKELLESIIKDFEKLKKDNYHMQEEIDIINKAALEQLTQQLQEAKQENALLVQNGSKNEDVTIQLKELRTKKTDRQNTVIQTLRRQNIALKMEIRDKNQELQLEIELRKTAETESKDKAKTKDQLSRIRAALNTKKGQMQKLRHQNNTLKLQVAELEEKCDQQPKRVEADAISEEEKEEEHKSKEARIQKKKARQQQAHARRMQMYKEKEEAEAQARNIEKRKKQAQAQEQADKEEKDRKIEERRQRAEDLFQAEKDLEAQAQTREEATQQENNADKRELAQQLFNKQVEAEKKETDQLEILRLNKGDLAVRLHLAQDMNDRRNHTQQSKREDNAKDYLLTSAQRRDEPFRNIPDSDEFVRRAGKRWSSDVGDVLSDILSKIRKDISTIKGFGIKKSKISESIENTEYWKPVVSNTGMKYVKKVKIYSVSKSGWVKAEEQCVVYEAFNNGMEPDNPTDPKQITTNSSGEIEIKSVIANEIPSKSPEESNRISLVLPNMKNADDDDPVNNAVDLKIRAANATGESDEDVKAAAFDAAVQAGADKEVAAKIVDKRFQSICLVGWGYYNPTKKKEVEKVEAGLTTMHLSDKKRQFFVGYSDASQNVQKAEDYMEDLMPLVNVADNDSNWIEELSNNDKRKIYYAADYVAKNSVYRLSKKVSKPNEEPILNTICNNDYYKCGNQLCGDGDSEDSHKAQLLRRNVINRLRLETMRLSRKLSNSGFFPKNTLAKPVAEIIVELLWKKIFSDDKVKPINIKLGKEESFSSDNVKNVPKIWDYEPPKDGDEVVNEQGEKELAQFLEKTRKSPINIMRTNVINAATKKYEFATDQELNNALDEWDREEADKEKQDKEYKFESLSKYGHPFSGNGWESKTSKSNTLKRQLVQEVNPVERVTETAAAAKEAEEQARKQAEEQAVKEDEEAAEAQKKFEIVVKEKDNLKKKMADLRKLFTEVKVKKNAKFVDLTGKIRKEIQQLTQLMRARRTGHGGKKS